MSGARPRGPHSVRRQRLRANRRDEPNPHAVSETHARTPGDLVRERPRGGNPPKAGAHVTFGEFRIFGGGTQQPVPDARGRDAVRRRNGRRSRDVFLVHGGEAMPWTAYLNDGNLPRGSDFIRTVKELAERAGVNPGPLDYAQKVDRRADPLVEAPICGVAWRAHEFAGTVRPDSPAPDRRAALARAARTLGTLPPRLALEQEDAIHAIAERCGCSSEAVTRSFRARFWIPPQRERQPPRPPTNNRALGLQR